MEINYTTSQRLALLTIMFLGIIFFIIDITYYLENGYWDWTTIANLNSLPAEHLHTNWVGFWNIVYEPLTWPFPLLAFAAGFCMVWFAEDDLDYFDDDE